MTNGEGLVRATAQLWLDGASFRGRDDNAMPVILHAPDRVHEIAGSGDQERPFVVA